ncbi:MAG TPA: hypothetical protein VD908_16485 [Cytophagales bacterium]|nr:hypothetical protein [Cytophagales bacterium]
MKTFRHQLLYLLSLICLPIVSFGQVEQPDRLEIPFDEYKFDMNIMPLGDNGVLSYKETFEFNDKGDILWEFVKYDTLFNTSWTNKYYISSNYKYVGYHNEGTYFYILFTKGDYHNTHFKILRLNNYNGEVLAYDDKFLVPLSLTEFKAMENAALLCGIVKENPVVVLYNFENKKSQVLPAIYQKNASFVSLDLEPEKGIFNVTLSHRLYGSKTTISIKTYSLKGELINNISLKPTKGLNLITGKMTSLSNGERFVTGTYSNYRFSEYSKGMFIAKLINGQQEFIEYYPYTDLKNFFSYMKPKRQERIKEKINKRKMRGKEVKLTYRLYMHDIIPMKDRFIVIGEAYYPQYTQEYTTYGTVPVRHFEGYKYTHAIVCGFDSQGNLLWDNSFGISDVLTPQLIELVNVKPSVGKVHLLYNSGTELITKVVNGYEVIEEKTKEKIKTNFSNDIVSRDNKFGWSEYWYNDYFITWGTQDIRNYKDKNVDNNRKVFYLNKVKVQ